jgi:hypothetical protein
VVIHVCATCANACKFIQGITTFHGRASVTQFQCQARDAMLRFASPLPWRLFPFSTCVCSSRGWTTRFGKRSTRRKWPAGCVSKNIKLTLNDSMSLPFPFQRCAAVTGRKLRLVRDISCTAPRRVGAVQINLSANAAEQISPYPEFHVASSCLPQDATVDAARSLCSALTSSSSCSPFCARSGSSTSRAM